MLLCGCNAPHPDNSIFISELGIWADDSEVRVKDFSQFKTYFELKLRTDSVPEARVFIDSLGTFKTSSSANFSVPDGKNPADSLWPVTQITWGEACAYCNAANGRLPTKDEWLVMSNGDYLPGNIWEGYFPYKDEGLDGYKARVARVKSFEKNSYNLYDIYGNVIEWTSSTDSSGNVIVKGGSFLTDYNSGCFLPKFEEVFLPTTAQCDIGFRCVYDF